MGVRKRVLRMMMTTGIENGTSLARQSFMSAFQPRSRPPDEQQQLEPLACAEAGQELEVNSPKIRLAVPSRKGRGPTSSPNPGVERKSGLGGDDEAGMPVRDQGTPSQTPATPSVKNLDMMKKAITPPKSVIHTQIYTTHVQPKCNGQHVVRQETHKNNPQTIKTFAFFLGHRKDKHHFPNQSKLILSPLGPSPCTPSAPFSPSTLLPSGPANSIPSHSFSLSFALSSNAF